MNLDQQLKSLPHKNPRIQLECGDFLYYRDDGTFGGSASVTRQELAAMLYRCAGLEGEGEAGGGLTAFPDASTIAPWASDAMAWAVGRGLIRGNTAQAGSSCSRPSP